MRGVGNFSFLLVGLLVAILSTSLLDIVFDESSVIVQQALFSVTLLLGVWTLAKERVWFLLGLTLAGAEIVLIALGIALGRADVVVPILILSLAFCVMSTLFAGHYVFVSERVDSNRIVGALCVYLLLGVTWALLYSLVEIGLGNNSFTGLVGLDGDGRLRELLYFSFVTLTTLGYGDIAPVSPAAKALATMQAVAGQFYLTVLVAELVGVHVATRHSRLESRRALAANAPELD